MFVVGSMLFLTACAPSMKITGNWMNKDVMGHGKFKKVFLFVITSNKGAQQSFEDAHRSGRLNDTPFRRQSARTRAHFKPFRQSTDAFCFVGGGR